MLKLLSGLQQLLVTMPEPSTTLSRPHSCATRQSNLLYQALLAHQVLSSGRASSGSTTGVGISQELGEM